MLPLAVSIYAYSALGKFDAQFLNTVGKELIEFAGSFLPWKLIGGVRTPPRYSHLHFANG